MTAPPTPDRTNLTALADGIIATAAAALVARTIDEANTLAAAVDWPATTTARELVDACALVLNAAGGLATDSGRLMRGRDWLDILRREVHAQIALAPYQPPAEPR